MTQTSRDNHFIPQFYLRNWSDDGKHIWAYRILISHKNVPEWEYRSIEKTAYLRDLYTTYMDEKEIDDYERWLGEEIENPAINTLKKVLKNNPLNSRDWESLIMLLAAQDIRTPLSYLESIERWGKTFPEILQSSVEKSLERYQQYLQQNRGIESPDQKENFCGDNLKVEVNRDNNSVSGGGYVKVDLQLGRSLWVQSQKWLLSNTVKALKFHKWSIVRPSSGYSWFTSDHPVVKLNFNDENNYDLRGGWGSENTDIFMPLSPKHLLFTQIGSDIPEKLKLSSKETKFFQKCIAERALRWIFGKDRLYVINKLRPRHIDPDLFKREEEQWENWNLYQSGAEKS